MCVLDATPTGQGGCAIQENFITLTNRIGPCLYTATRDPGVNDDSDDTSGVGVKFSKGSQWIRSDQDEMWVCVDAAAGAAKWYPIEQWGSATTPTADTIARRTGTGNLCACDLYGSKVCAAGAVFASCCVKAGTDLCAACNVCAGANVMGGFVCSTSDVSAAYCVTATNCVYAASACFCILSYTTSDPSLVLYFPESRENIVRLSKRSIPPERGDGAAVFYNRDTRQIELYKMNEGKFCSLSGELLETLDTPVLATGEDVEEVYKFDGATGTVVKQQRLRAESTRLKNGYAVDPVTGKVLRKKDGVEVDVQDAVEVRRLPKAVSLAEQIARRQGKKAKKKSR